MDFPQSRSRGLRRRTAVTTIAALAASFLYAQPVAAAGDRWDPPDPQRDHLVEGTPVPVKGGAADPAERSALKAPPKVVWPRAGSATADLSALPALAGKPAAQNSAAQNPAAVRDAGAPDARPALVGLSGLPVRIGPGRGVAEAARASAATQPSAAQPSSAQSSSAQSSPAQPSAAAPGKVRVDLLNPVASSLPGDTGVRLRVTRADGAAQAAPVTLELDYSGFRGAYGGDWAARLRLVELPACAATATPATGLASVPAGTGGCPAPRPVPGTNDVARGTLTAEIGAAPASSGPATSSAPAADAARETAAGATGNGSVAGASASGAGLYALAAAPSGGTGDYTATPLSPSADWEVSPQSGDFSWSYPMRVPPSLGGPAPELALAYSSSGVDGRTASTNNQPSWVGEGFDLNPGGFIERKYKSCADDGVTPKNGELCWGGDNAVVVLGGGANELVHDAATGAWRLKNDDGSRVEKLTGAVNGDDGDGDGAKGEHWKITQPDGTQFFFGLNRLPGWVSGKQETGSTWTVPVYGDDSGEPCHKTAYADSWCQQAYRWNLDHVIDTHGNTMSFFYTKETNHYGRNMKAADETPYTASGYLDRIEYGQRAGQAYAKLPVGKVLFSVDERCVRTPTFDCAPAKLTKANAAYWPDVPADLLCASGADCANHAPVFFTRKRLTAVTTQVLKDGALTDVDTWTLTQSFPKPGDNMSAALWLARIQHTGKVGGALSTPPVDFDGVEMPNRVDALEGVAPMMKWRIRSVNNETGGRLTVVYSDPQCTRASLPQPHANGRRCYPVFWTPEGATAPGIDWFHKYVAVQTQEVDLTGGSPMVRTDYVYKGDPAWAYDDLELAPASRRTWSAWRGYEKVQVVTGEAPDRRTAVEHLFFRGLDGDKQPSGTRSVQVTDSEGGKVTDHWRLQGFERETRQLDGPDGAEVSATVNDPWLQGPNATEGSDQAYRLSVAKVRGRSKLSTGAIRRTETRNSFDTYGSLTSVDDLGDIGTTSDDQCLRNTYARNTGAWILNAVVRSEKVAVACDTTPRRPDDVLEDVRTYYDGGAYGAAPTKGDVTRTEDLRGYANGQPVYQQAARAVYDAYGRKTESYDAADAKSTTSYTPAADAAPVKTVVTNPLGHTETTALRPEWSVTAAQDDANGRHTELAYDPLGRLAKVWLPDRPTGQSPSQEFTYTIEQGAPVAVATKTLNNEGGYDVSYEIYDGLLRTRQNQQPAHGGGRLLSDTVYNTLGQIAKVNDVYANADAPGPLILGVADSAVPAQTVYAYDGLGRTTAEILKVMGDEKWRTTTAYNGERTDVDPPEGSTPTTTIADARGRTVELRQYKGPSPVGAYDTTRYGYSRGGEQDTVTDPAGNVWRTTRDLRGRVVRTEDPDRGTTAYTYDDLDRIATSTDAENRTLAFEYDVLGRRTAVHAGKTTQDPTIASWTYDTLPDGTSVKGMPVSATRWNGTNAYVTRVDAYDSAYRATANSYVVPASEGRLAGTYTFKTRYNPDGTVQSVTYPEAGNLPAETVRTTYTDQAMPLQTRSGLGTYVNDTLYSKSGEALQERWGEDGRQILNDYTYEEGTRRLLRRITDRQTDSKVRQGDLNYEYDESGNLTRIADTPPAANAASDIQCFRYDHLRRVSHAWTTTGACTTTPDANGGVTPSGVGGATPYWNSYTYDLTGARQTETRHAVNGATGDTVSTFSYPATGQPQAHAPKQVSTTGPGVNRTDAYFYDKTGNTTTRRVGSAEQTLEWDAEGHLAKVTEAGRTTSFMYDAEGNRLIRRDPSGTVLYLGVMEVRVDTGSTTPSATRYYTHGDRTIAVRGNDQRLTWLVSDHHGTAELAIDAASLEVTRRRFDPFGNPRGEQPGSWPSQRAFVGGTADLSTGLVHLGAREYLPSEGRFLSVDPVFDSNEPQKLNGYTYAGNNPVTESDPDGNDWGCILCGLLIRAVTAITRAFMATMKAIRDAWHRFVDYQRRLVERARERARQLAEEARKRAAEARRKAEELRRKAQQARERAQRAVRKQTSRACRTLIVGCDVRPLLNRSGLGKPFSCSSFPDPGKCNESTRKFGRAVHEHLKVQVGYCAGLCASLSYQRGVVQLSAGPGGAGVGGAVQWASASPDEQGPVGASVCGAIVIPVGPCYSVGPKVDENGNWNGLQDAKGIGIAEGEIEPAAEYNVVTWDIPKGRAGIKGPGSPLPGQLRDTVCDAWWAWQC
ncbi:RHS repeat domain-containing protein [Microbispora amethystogenes]|uniref:Teneurin-like YD-shell domain-containing protein n=1 Tax=Microbispora amethystogenes TaxID=1427754 RepID=A0ABQ4FNK3_9ACTN|nr:RHS repeat-associated core domain-containing protein [Microbispora amethystogenes]GIH36333.1 hypothetical protein Mam01_64970 [Microbispora amethystogenes]